LEAIANTTDGWDKVGATHDELSYITDNFELIVEEIADATDGGDRVGTIHYELSRYYGGFLTYYGGHC
jgi:hypothetical protein